MIFGEVLKHDWTQITQAKHGSGIKWKWEVCTCYLLPFWIVFYHFQFPTLASIVPYIAF